MTPTETDTTTSISRATRWTYLAAGEVASISRGYGSVEATTLAFGYDDARRLVSISDELGNRIVYTLDTEGNRLSETTYDANGTPGASADDRIQQQLVQTFDLYNRLDTATRAKGEIGDRPRLFTADECHHWAS